MNKTNFSKKTILFALLLSLLQISQPAFGMKTKKQKIDVLNKVPYDCFLVILPFLFGYKIKPKQIIDLARVNKYFWKAMKHCLNHRHGDITIILGSEVILKLLYATSKKLEADYPYKIKLENSIIESKSGFFNNNKMNFELSATSEIYGLYDLDAYYDAYYDDTLSKTPLLEDLLSLLKDKGISVTTLSIIPYDQEQLVKILRLYPNLKKIGLYSFNRCHKTGCGNSIKITKNVTTGHLSSLTAAKYLRKLTISYPKRDDNTNEYLEKVYKKVNLEIIKAFKQLRKLKISNHINVEGIFHEVLPHENLESITICNGIIKPISNEVTIYLEERKPDLGNKLKKITLYKIDFSELPNSVRLCYLDANSTGNYLSYPLHLMNQYTIEHIQIFMQKILSSKNLEKFVIWHCPWSENPTFIKNCFQKIHPNLETLDLVVIKMDPIEIKHSIYSCDAILKNRKQLKEAIEEAMEINEQLKINLYEREL